MKTLFWIVLGILIGTFIATVVFAADETAADVEIEYLPAISRSTGTDMTTVDDSPESKKDSKHSPGDIFRGANDIVITLIEQVPIYAADDACLSMQRAGYLIMCEPDPIRYDWSCEIKMSGVVIDGTIDPVELNGLEQIQGD